MTKDEIIKLAREAGAAVGQVMPDGPEIIFPNCMDVHLFASLVIQQERERCAKLCDDLDQKLWEDMGEPMSGYGDAIRERT